jgi:hypothetical protein
VGPDGRDGGTAGGDRVVAITIARAPCVGVCCGSAVTGRGAMLLRARINIRLMRPFSTDTLRGRLDMVWISHRRRSQTLSARPPTFELSSWSRRRRTAACRETHRPSDRQALMVLRRPARDAPERGFLTRQSGRGHASLHTGWGQLPLPVPRLAISLLLAPNPITTLDIYTRGEYASERGKRIHATGNRPVKLTWSMEGVTCGHCVQTIINALAAVAGVAVRALAVRSGQRARRAAAARPRVPSPQGRGCCGQQRTSCGSQ